MVNVGSMNSHFSTLQKRIGGVMVNVGSMNSRSSTLQ